MPKSASVFLRIFNLSGIRRFSGAISLGFVSKTAECLPLTSCTSR